MQNTSAQSEGRLSTLMKRKESSDESSKSPGWTNAPASGTASQESTKEEHQRDKQGASSY